MTTTEKLEDNETIIEEFLENFEDEVSTEICRDQRILNVMDRLNKSKNKTE